MDVLLGLLAVCIGAVVCLSGHRLHLMLLPVAGFVAGVLVGAAGATAVFGDGFLSTTLGIVIGIVIGIVFAFASYLYWYVGAILAAGSAGAIFGAALFASIGLDSPWFLFFIGLVFAVVFTIGAVAINYPFLVVIASTALAGSALVICGLLLVLDEIDRAELGSGATWQRIDDNLILWILWIAGTAIGIGAQAFKAESDALQVERWARA